MVKAIIGKKVFDTENAVEIATHSNGYGYSDFNHCEETLYRTQNGTWFIVGGGGPMSKYRVTRGNGYSGSTDNITPLSDERAYAWLEERDKTSAIEEHFSELLENA